MEIIHVDQTDTANHALPEFDFFLAASGYEKRCTYLDNHLKPLARKKYVIGFEEQSEIPQRQSNDNYFLREGFAFFQAAARDREAIVNILEEILPATSDEPLSLLVDYSCMTKDWYAAIFDHLLASELELASLEVYFAYTPARFSRPKKMVFTGSLQNLQEEMEYIHHNRETALILGLGYESGLAGELIKTLQPEQVYAFYTDGSIDPAYSEQVKKNHARLLSEIGPSGKFEYPLNDMKKGENLLTSIVLEQRLNRQVVLAPIGPKPFTMLCLLVSSKYPDVKVWKIQSGQPESVYEKSAGANPIICRTVFAGDAYCL